MNISDLESMDENEQRRKAVNFDANFRELNRKLRELHAFLGQLDFLMFGRDFQVIKGVFPFSPNEIISSSSQTLNNMILCCEVGSFGDAYTLLRKLRDNLFFYLYILEASNSTDILSETEMNKHELNIKRWLQNELSGLYFRNILQFLSDSNSLNPAIEKYSLEEAINKINGTLNNYVHSNGAEFLNHPVGYHFNKDTKAFSDELYSIAELIIVSFLFFLILLQGNLISSTDYVDSLDCQQEPEEGSQYWVAPFVKEFVQNHVGVLGDDCDEFLKKATYMKI
ncbi:MAG: hypothetical protein ABFC56_02560 [Clostridiaceae bacterium]